MIIVRMSQAAQTAAIDAAAFPSGAVRLSDWGLIRARGEDATTFLQGQFTNDLASAGLHEARLAGYCSAKGRLQASFIAWKAAPDEWLLACSAELLPGMLKRLSMFVLRARCKLTDASTELGLWGAAGAAALSALGEAAPAQAWQISRPADASQVLRLPDALGQPRFLLAAPLAAQAATPDAPAPLPAALAALPALPAAAWRWLEVASGVARVVGATAEAFVPQMVNFELVGGVNFKKGCYPGQEVVARSQYRGTVKRRGYLLAGDAPMSEGQEVFASTDPAQPAGTIALAANWAEHGSLAFVELKRAVSAGELHLGAADGPLLRLQTLPYALPGEDA